MTASEALRFSWCLLSLGILVQSLELRRSPKLFVLAGRRVQVILGLRILLSLMPWLGLWWNSSPMLDGLFLFLLWLTNMSLFILFQGGFSGGSDSMMNLALIAIWIGQWAPMNKACVYFIAVQSLASYFIAGIVKLRQPDWRSGLALQNFLRMTIFTTPNWLQQMSARRSLMQLFSWSLMATEIIFPLAILRWPELAWPFLGLGIAFHFINAYCFGLNRFLYAWLSTYPCVFFLSQAQ